MSSPNALMENNRLWWQNKVRELERAVIVAERVGDKFLARAERAALSDALENLALCLA